MRTSIRFNQARAVTFIVVASMIATPVKAKAQSKGIHPQPAPLAHAVKLTSGVSVDGACNHGIPPVAAGRGKTGHAAHRSAIRLR
jgi:hypothetical protein